MTEVEPVGAELGAVAQQPPSSAAGRGMFGVQGTGDTSGFGGLRRRRTVELDSPRPFGGEFDEVVDALEESYAGLHDAIERIASYSLG